METRQENYFDFVGAEAACCGRQGGLLRAPKWRPLKLANCYVFVCWAMAQVDQLEWAPIWRPHALPKCQPNLGDFGVLFGGNSCVGQKWQFGAIVNADFECCNIAWLQRHLELHVPYLGKTQFGQP